MHDTITKYVQKVIVAEDKVRILKQELVKARLELHKRPKIFTQLTDMQAAAIVDAYNALQRMGAPRSSGVVVWLQNEFPELCIPQKESK